MRSIAPAAPRIAVTQNPSAKAMTAPKVRTVPQGTPVVVISVRSSGQTAVSGGHVDPEVGEPEARRPFQGCHGVISQPNIIAWSSWARLWQCAT